MPHISEPDLKPEVASAARAILNDAAILQSRWPREISIGRTEQDTPSIYDCFPYLFIEAFPGVPDQKVQRLSLAGRLYASSLFLCDALMDQEMKGLKAAVASANVTVLQSEAGYLLHDLFPSASGFWPLFRSYLRDYIEACLREKEFTIGNRSWDEYTDEVALGIVTGKDGFSRAAIAGLCELSGDDSLLEALTESIRHYYIGRQMYDDLIDWKSDLRDNSPSLVLARLLRTRPPVVNTDRHSPEIAELARDLYYQGHAEYVLELALDSLHKADLFTLQVPDLSWRAAIEQAQLHCTSLLSDIRAIIAENRIRVSHQPAVRFGLPEPDDDWLRIGEDALRYVLGQWQTGFGEVKHVMKFASEYGFSSPREFHSGDVFQRALIAEALCDANDALGGEFSDVIAHETDYLIASRINTGVGGWSYFPSLPELPPDADDLGQIMQVLFKTGRFAELEQFCAEPLKVLLTDNYHEESGSFDTWIVPKNNRTPQQELQAEWVRRAWGKGADPDVVANLGWGLNLCYAEEHRGVIQKAVDFLCQIQDSDGKWTSTWYHGPFYGTYVCTRLIGAVRPDSVCLPKALEFLLAGQHADGGWGFEENQSDPLSTSLALLTFAYLASVTPDQRITQAALCALEYLKNSQLEDRSWPACLFIRMDVGRATGEIWKRLIFARKTITTMYVMKAALVWWQGSTGVSTWQQLLLDSNKAPAVLCQQ